MGLAAPSFEDQPRMPYMMAFIREVYRWRNATPSGTISSQCPEA